MPAPTTTDPRTEYTRRLDARQTTVQFLEGRDALLANLRLAVFLAGGAVLWAVGARGWLSAGWVAAPVLGFLALMVAHDRTLRALTRARSAAAYYERALARLDGRWAGTGVTDTTLAAEDHLYAADLDLFGAGSLFDLLCTARTRTGQRTLADWLCTGADREVILARQAAVEELRSNVDLREDLAVLAGEMQATVRPSILCAWAEAPTRLHSAALRAAAAVLGTACTFCGFGWLIAWRLDSGFVLPFLVTLVAGRLLRWSVRAPLRELLEGINEPARELDVLAGVLARIEREPMHSARLRELHAQLVIHGTPASAGITTLQRRVEWLEARLNQFFAPLGFLLLWDLQFAGAIDAWRAQYGTRIPQWLATVGELEALCALAAYAYEHPADPFPDMDETGPPFDGEGLGHPLLPDADVVRNSVRLDDRLRVLVVSGSNMSGKSTLLRTVGVNAVLAMMGAPVRATRLRLRPMAIGASVRTLDSLQAGTSRFYAEIQRLRRIMDLTREPQAVLFLLDELLHGTNSHDRRIGAEGVVRGLIDGGAVGLVTTHDLALAQSADALAPRAANVHFEDQLVDGHAEFDYTLRDGVVTKSNALELMRAVGLDV